MRKEEEGAAPNTAALYILSSLVSVSGRDWFPGPL